MNILIRLFESELFPKLLIAQYTIAAIAYLVIGNYPKAFYWLGALIIVSSVLAMK